MYVYIYTYVYLPTRILAYSKRLRFGCVYVYVYVHGYGYGYSYTRAACVRLAASYTSRRADIVPTHTSTYYSYLYIIIIRVYYTRISRAIIG